MEDILYSYVDSGFSPATGKAGGFAERARGLDRHALPVQYPDGRRKGGSLFPEPGMDDSEGDAARTLTSQKRAGVAPSTWEGHLIAWAVSEAVAEVPTRPIFTGRPQLGRKGACRRC